MFHQSLIRSSVSIKILFACIFAFSNSLYGQDLQQITQKQKPKIAGGISLSSTFYNVGGIAPRYSPFTYVLSGNLTATVQGINIPISFVYSDMQRNITQPFNQFGMSPYYKWIKLHLGYRSLTFSPYTLAGHTILGAGIELTPKKFRFALMSGTFKQQTTYSADIMNASYKRKGFAMKIGVGTQRNYFDIILLQAADDSNSLDIGYKGKVSPAKNFVTGFNTKFAFAKNLTFESDGAISLYTTNIASDSIYDVDYKKQLDILNKLAPINYSTEYYTAIQSALVYKIKRYSVKLKYRRIDPNYKTMGTYYLNNDMECLTIDPSGSFFKQKLSIRGSIGEQRDNLRNTKKATSFRTAGSMNITYQPNQKFGIDASYSNFATNQKAGRSPLLSDTMKVYQSTGTMNVMPRYVISNAKKMHMFSLNYSRTQLNDKNASTSYYSNMIMDNVLLNYMISFIPEHTSLSAGINYLNLNMAMVDNKSYGVTFMASREIKAKINLSLSPSIFRTIAKEGKAWVLNTNLAGKYKINNHHSLQMSVCYIGNNAGFTNNPSYNEFKGEITYGYKF